MSAYVLTRKRQTLETPSFINLIFNYKRFSILWLAARVWLGWQWIYAGLHKLSNPGWRKTGEALKAFGWAPFKSQLRDVHRLHLTRISASFRRC